MKHTAIEKKVMNKIKKGGVKLRSRYVFLVEKLGMGSVFVLTILLAILFSSLVLLYLKSSDNLAYLSFGNLGLLAFLESFPYFLVIVLVVLMGIAGFLIKKSDVSYKVPFGYYALGLVGSIMVAGVLVSATTIDERIEDEAYRPHPFGMMLRPFLLQGIDDRERGIAGRVIEVGDGYIRVQTSRAVRIIDLQKLRTRLQDPVIEGGFVIGVGQRNDGTFQAQEIRIIDSTQMPMIRRGVHRHFGPFMMQGVK